MFSIRLLLFSVITFVIHCVIIDHSSTFLQTFPTEHLTCNKSLRWKLVKQKNTAALLKLLQECFYSHGVPRCLYKVAWKKQVSHVSESVLCKRCLGVIVDWFLTSWGGEKNSKADGKGSRLNILYQFAFYFYRWLCESRSRIKKKKGQQGRRKKMNQYLQVLANKIESPNFVKWWIILII